ncbi:MAG: hypothetical protein M1812_003504 [Candelaria pacifica]|nr:MAG: hypothetical protein M1812_003504 [Candelaria pacifica]
MSNEPVQVPAEDLVRSTTLEQGRGSSAQDSTRVTAVATTPEINITATPTPRAPTPPTRTSSTKAVFTTDGSSNPVNQVPVTADGGEANIQPPDDLNKLKEKQSQLEVPSRSSSHAIHQPSPTSTALTGATASDPAESIGKNSKGSISGKRRRASATSSKRSLEASGLAENNIAQPAEGDESKDGTATEKPKKKGPVSRFLAVLNCCGVPDSANSVGKEDPLVPSKKSNKLQPTRTRQSTPGKQGAGPIGSSAAESEKPLNEKPVVAHESEKTEPLAESKQPNEATEVPVSSDNTVPDAKAGDSNSDKKPPEIRDNTQEQSLPVLPETTSPSESRNMNTQTPSQSFGSGVAAETLTPPVASTMEEPATTGKAPSQAQQDTDVEMTDAPPPMPSTEVPGEEPINKDVQTRSTDLPPPPPLAPREAQSVLVTSPTQDVATLPLTEKQQWLLPPIQPRFKGKKCLVLDLDETLVHSSFKILHQADFTIPVEIEGQYHNVYVIKRPGVDQFMKRVGELYEVVVFTASVSKYGDPLLDQLDIHHVVHHRLFRESCYNHQGNYVKDLSQVGRDLKETIIIDNSPTSYIFHPQHAVPISSWFSDAHDNELLDLIPVLEDLAGPRVRDVSLVLDVAL